MRKYLVKTLEKFLLQSLEIESKETTGEVSEKKNFVNFDTDFWEEFQKE